MGEDTTTKEQFRIIMSKINTLNDNFNSLEDHFQRLEARFDNHIENQSSIPIQQFESLKSMISECFYDYKEETSVEIERANNSVKTIKREIYGNGKKGLINDMNIVKTKVNMLVWLVGILLTGGGLSAVGLIVWKILGGG